jgi:hypothetical protein
MTIIGLHIVLREGGPTAIHDKHPRSRCGLNRFPDSEDLS